MEPDSPSTNGNRDSLDDIDRFEQARRARAEALDADADQRSDASSDAGAGVGMIANPRKRFDAPERKTEKPNVSANTEALLRKIEGLQMIVDAKDRELTQAKEEVAAVSHTAADTEFTTELKNRVLAMTKKNRELQDKIRSKEVKASEVEQRLKKLEAERLDRLKNGD